MKEADSQEPAERGYAMADDNGANSQRDRCVAAIATIDALTLNLRTIRRGSFPPDVKRRIGEILRLSSEVTTLLHRSVRQ